MSALTETPGGDPLDRETDAAQFSDEGVAGLTTDWSVPWSDLMMVLFILFVVLFVFERSERTVSQAFHDMPLFPDERTVPSFPALEPDAPGGSSLAEESRTAVRATGLAGVGVEQRPDRSVAVSASGEAFFDLGKADLKPATVSLLDELAPVLRRHAGEIEIVGHTDSFPIHSAEFPTNWELSAARASRVARYLIERGSLDPARFVVVAHALYRPAAPNIDAESRARNRRVEIVITGLEPPREVAR